MDSTRRGFLAGTIGILSLPFLGKKAAPAVSEPPVTIATSSALRGPCPGPTRIYAVGPTNGRAQYVFDSPRAQSVYFVPSDHLDKQPLVHLREGQVVVDFDGPTAHGHLMIFESRA
jgi:hypothetical protein